MNGSLCKTPTIVCPWGLNVSRGPNHLLDRWNGVVVNSIFGNAGMIHAEKKEVARQEVLW